VAESRGPPIQKHHDAQDASEVLVPRHQVRSAGLRRREDDRIDHVEPVADLQLRRLLRHGAIDLDDRGPRLDDSQAVRGIVSLCEVLRLEFREAHGGHRSAQWGVPTRTGT